MRTSRELNAETGVSAAMLTDAVDCAFMLAREEMLWRKTEDGTAAALEEMKKRGYILGVVSNSDGRIESAFQQAGLTSYFDFFIDSFHVGVEKPNPEIFLLATERAMVSPEQAAYVGDLYWDGLLEGSSVTNEFPPVLGRYEGLAGSRPYYLVTRFVDRPSACWWRPETSMPLATPAPNSNPSMAPITI